MKRGIFLTFFSDITPCHIPPNVAFTLLYIDSFLSRKWRSTNADIPQTAVTKYPMSEKRLRMDSMLVPVREKNTLKMFNCNKSVSPENPATTSESMARSVTTVPNALENDTPSYRLSTPQRVNSPTRGMTRLAA